MSKTDLVRAEISLSPLTEEEIEIIKKRRLEERYNAITARISKIVPITRQITRYGGYGYSRTDIENVSLHTIISKLPIAYLEALENVNE